MNAEPVVLEGFHALKHALRFGARLEQVLALDRDRVLALADRLAPDVVVALGALLREVPRDELARLSPRVHHTGVVARARRPAFAQEDLPEDRPLVLLEDPRDLGNVGAVVRVAAAADAAGVLVTGDRDPWAAEALRGSAGLHFALPVVRAAGPPGGRALIALDPDGAPFSAGAVPRGAVLAFGGERDGLSDALKDRADAVLALPMRPGVSSLNLATSVSAVLYALALSGA